MYKPNFNNITLKVRLLPFAVERYFNCGIWRRVDVLNFLSSDVTLQDVCLKNLCFFGAVDLGN